MKPLFMAWFADEAGILTAARAARDKGLIIYDAYVPFPVHGLDEVLGLKPSRLTWVCFAAALTGLSIALGFQWWSSAVDWPLNVGGKPFNSLPVFVPVAFELTVLFAGLGTVAALFLRSGLFPRRRPSVDVHRATNDRFVLALEVKPGFDEEQVRALFVKCGALDEHWEERR